MRLAISATLGISVLLSRNKSVDRDKYLALLLRLITDNIFEGVK